MEKICIAGEDYGIIVCDTEKCEFKTYSRELHANYS